MVRASAEPLTAWDIECAGQHLVCVGIMHVESGEYVCPRFREQHGALTLSPEEMYDVVEQLDSALCDPSLPKVFHNGQAFDIPYLEQLGFGPVEGFAFDTLLAQRYLYPEMPADLQFVAGFYARVPAWKWMAKLEGEEEDK